MSNFCYPCRPHLRNAAGPYKWVASCRLLGARQTPLCGGNQPYPRRVNVAMAIRVISPPTATDPRMAANSSELLRVGSGENGVRMSSVFGLGGRRRRTA